MHTMEVPSRIRELMEAAGCEERCVLEVEYSIEEHADVVVHAPREGMSVSPESLLRLPHRRLAGSLEEEVAHRRALVLERMEADHRLWREGLRLELTEEEEARERARLRPVEEL